MEIYNSARITNVDLSRDGVVEYAHICHNGATFVVNCQELVLAAGPWTPTLFKTLFPGSNDQFESSTSSANWMVVEHPHASGSDARGQVFFNDGAGNLLEIVSRGDGKIWLSGINDNSTLITDVADEASPDADAVSKLQDIARYFILHSESTSANGRTYRPTISRKLPIIARITSSMLCDNSILEKATVMTEERNTGVYLLFGHDRHGLTHGMGSGALMSQLILGLPTDLNIDKYRFPD